MILCPYILSVEPESLHSEIQIVLDACTIYANFKDIFKKASTLKNVMLRAFCIVKLVLTLPVSYASNERSFGH